MQEREDIAARRRRLQRSRARFDRVARPALIVAAVVLAAIVILEMVAWHGVPAVPGAP